MWTKRESIRGPWVLRGLWHFFMNLMGANSDVLALRAARRRLMLYFGRNGLHLHTSEDAAMFGGGDYLTLA
jgi:hypothetical protein